LLSGIGSFTVVARADDEDGERSLNAC